MKTANALHRAFLAVCQERRPGDLHLMTLAALIATVEQPPELGRYPATDAFVQRLRTHAAETSWEEVCRVLSDVIVATEHSL